MGPSHDPPTVYVAKHQENAAQHSGVKNVTCSRMLLKSQKPEDSDGHTEEIPAEAFLCKPQAVTDSADSPDSAEMGSDSGCGVSSSTSPLTTSPSHGTVCLPIKEGKNYKILNAEEVGSSCFLDEFQSKQKFMEEQNRQRKELLTKALADRKRQTTAEAVRLQQIQDELQKLDALLSNDVSILRDQIEVASREFMEAQKRYSEAEKEFLDAKLLLFERLERKELLTEHLCTIIEQNELRKARKLSELMNRLQLGGHEDDQKTAAKNMVHLPITVLQVQSGEPFDCSQHVQSVISTGQFPVVHTQAEDPVLDKNVEG
ncbi:RAB6-interacting golgin isoform X3 [Cryptotermes secundus]|uniref:RAB6-interacting golgin isoform X3 n=1 Tax=Cryptotermes secundus TaxID=105785 RepID=UPI000CD7D1AC|nr:RAB6-interacting golgin isoform X3 [Cryptotermes secundus]